MRYTGLSALQEETFVSKGTWKFGRKLKCFGGDSKCLCDKEVCIYIYLVLCGFQNKLFKCPDLTPLDFCF